MSKLIDNYLDDTLKIRNIPVEISNRDKEKLLMHFGACSFKFVESKLHRSCIVYAKFETAQRARNALTRLHQANVFGVRLYVEFAKQESTPGSFVEISKVPGPSTSQTQSVQQKTGAQQLYDQFVERLNAWNKAVNFCQPAPAHLKYNYPKANVVTINNIAHALASVPKFYTQVLHLMNRMNLPPPFAKINSEPLASSELYTLRAEDGLIRSGDSDSERVQSELKRPLILPRSDSDSIRKRLKMYHSQQPQQLSQHSNHRRRQHHRDSSQESFGSYHSRSDASDVFDIVSLNRPKLSFKFDEHLPNDDSSERPSTPINNDTDCSFGLVDNLETNEEEIDVLKKISNLNRYQENNKISEDELKNNRISQKDLNFLPIFKDYHPGTPSTRLYIKNLSKSITDKELEYIFNRYVNDSEKVEIKVFNDGRMRGQAFVTFQSIDMATKALKETNGFIFKKKPMVVVFAKSSSS